MPNSNGNVLIGNGVHYPSVNIMASVKVIAKYLVAWFIVLSAIVEIFYWAFFVESPSLPYVWRRQCAWTKPKTKILRKNDNPPWISLLVDKYATNRSDRNLYVWVGGACGRRLGNRLFNYAAVFGIAWHNRRIPILQQNRGSRKHDITKFFNLRVPVDDNDVITRVRSLLC